jgi:hypothetical protein
MDSKKIELILIVMPNFPPFSAPDACTSFPCDVNALNCSLSGLSTNTSSDRICGPCRWGFRKLEDECIDIELDDIFHENIAAGNVAAYAAQLASIVTNRPQNQQEVSDLLSIALDLSLVCMGDVSLVV